ncbi:MAG: T9SS type A sorting domain-containing protein [Carboxylicivirga sp.]|jgi:hypothetical protein|nr:T9SS type A sorting domain-containing protein [Carboxylicivirga sp.]
MNRIYILIFCYLTLNPLSAQIVLFKDIKFKDAILSKYPDIDSNGNKEIELYEAREFKGTIDVGSTGITDLKGIEAFKNVTGLKCSLNRLTSIDLSSNKNLTSLQIYDNELEELDLSHCTLLVEVDCRSNNLQKINLQNCSSLERLLCQENQLKAINLEAQKNLIHLECSDNLLEHLNLSVCKRLSWLDCKDNNIYNLSFNRNPELGTVDCRNNKLKALSFSSNPKLWQLIASDNHLLSLDLTANPKIFNLEIENNHLNSLKIPYATLSSDWLKCNNNRFSLSTLVYLDGQITGKLNYSSNKSFGEEIHVQLESMISFHEEAVLQGVNSNFEWYSIGGDRVDGSYVKTVSGKVGEFIFLKSGIYYCIMRNPVLTGLSVKSNLVHVETSTDIADTKSNLQLKVFPNPLSFNSTVSLILPEGFNGMSNISIYTLSGDCKFKKETEDRIIKLDCKLKPGLFLIQVSNNKVVLTKRLMVN